MTKKDQAATAPEITLTPRGQIDDLLKQLRRRVEGDWQYAHDAFNNLARTQLARELAAAFLERDVPYVENPTLVALMEDGLLDKAVFIQKPPALLRFYRRLLGGMPREPSRILEIGVKGGGSTALWKALYPSATVVGLDIKLRPWLKGDSAGDGVVYLQGDQSDPVRLNDIASQYGPFDLVIDDGSHISEHQIVTLRSLLPHTAPGGFYVIEDVHTPLKAVDDHHHGVGYGGDIWPDFISVLFEKLRGARSPLSSAGAKLARDVAAVADDIVIGRRVIAIRIAAPADP